MCKKASLLFCASMLLLLCFSSFITAAGAVETPISIVIDGNTVSFGGDQGPVLAESGRILVPIRGVFESMGAKVNWSEETATATVTNENLSIVLTIGDNTAKKNDTEVTLEQPAELINGRTMVPVRFVCETLGAKVDWDGESKKVLITTPDPNAQTPAVDESTTDQQVYNKDKKVIKVLAIGNSFSEDAAKYLHDIATADGVDLTIVNLYIGGCTLQTHWNNVTSNAAAYDYQLNGVSANKKVSILETLESDSWDYITLQQASPDSGNEAKYYPYIEDLAKYVKTQEPQATLFIHQTWAYEKGSNHTGFPYYNSDQATMFSALKTAYDNAAAKVGLLTLDDGKEISPDKKPLKIIPCGEAFQKARANSIFDTTFSDGKAIRLNRDGYHASLTYGRYLLGAVWYECITGNKIADNTFCPDGVAQSELDVLKKAAHEAVVEYGW